MSSIRSSRRIVARAPVIGAAAADSRALRDFLGGRSEGELLLHGLFDHVLSEEVPDRLRAVLDRFPGADE